MTVATSSWEAGQQRNRRGKAAAASAGTGIQVVAVLFAVRVGYKLARSAGRVFFERNAPSVSSVSQDEQREDLEEFRDEGEEGQCVSARQQWVLCCDPQPEVPEGAKLMASEHLPISVYHFYEQFLSVETSCLQDHHKSTGQFNFRSSRWKGDGEGRFSRTFEFVQPKKGIASANAACCQEQRFSVHAGGVFVMTTDMAMTGIPYADAFRVQSFWKAAPDATGLGCHVSVHVAVPFSKRCMVKGLIMGATLKDCQGFFSDFLAKVQNSIATELLPAAAAQAAAAEQLLGDSPAAAASSAAAAAALNSHLPQPPPLLVTATPRGATPGAAGAGAAGPGVSPFAAVDAEVFVSTPLQAGGSAPQRKRSGGGGGRAVHGWFQWPKQHHHKPRQQQRQEQQHARDAAAASPPAAAAAVVEDVSGVLGPAHDSLLPQQQLHRRRGSQHHNHHHQQQQQWPPSPSPLPSPLRGHHHSQALSHPLRGLSPSPGPARPPSRSVSVKPSFALPIDDLRLPNRVRPAEFITTAQAILLLLVLVVQLITLYDNMAIRRLLAAAGPLGALDADAGI